MPLHARFKCLELDRIPRAEFDATIPRLIAANDTKIVSLVGFVETRAKALEASLQKLDTIATEDKLAGNSPSVSVPWSSWSRHIKARPSSTKIT